MTLVQISAIIGLLLAFGVPQSKTDEVRAILEHSQIATTQVVTTSSGILKPMENDLAPAYTQVELESKFGSWPVAVVTTQTTANIAWDGPFNNRGEVSVNGSVLLDKQGNTTLINYEGENYGIHTRDWTHLENLTSNTTYSYTFIWKESGREDTFIQKSFKTLQ